MTGGPRTSLSPVRAKRPKIDRAHFYDGLAPRSHAWTPVRPTLPRHEPLPEGPETALCGRLVGRWGTDSCHTAHCSRCPLVPKVPLTLTTPPPQWRWHEVPWALTSVAAVMLTVVTAATLHHQLLDVRPSVCTGSPCGLEHSSHGHPIVGSQVTWSLPKGCVQLGLGLRVASLYVFCACTVAVSSGCRNKTTAEGLIGDVYSSRSGARGPRPRCCRPRRRRELSA